MTVAWLPPGKQTFVDENGEPLAGGFVHHYIPGTDTRKDTWQDYDQNALNTNPIVLDERGQCMIWGSGSYRQVLEDVDSNEIWDRNTRVGEQPNILSGGSIYGMTIANNQANPYTAIDVAVGQCRDSTNTADIVFETPITKTITAVWLAGTGNGMRDAATALAAEQSYHMFAIMDPDLGLVDVLCSESATAPNLPNGYTLFRRIGSLPVLGGDVIPPTGTNIPLFQQWGDQFLLSLPNNEWTAQTGSAAALLRAFFVPLGIKVQALFYGQITLSPVAAATFLRVTDPDLGVPPAFGLGSQFGQLVLAADSTYLRGVFQETTNTSAQVYVQTNDATAIWALKTRGWIDTRGMFG